MTRAEAASEGQDTSPAGIRIDGVSTNDLPAVRTLLDTGGLPHEDLGPDHLTRFLAARVDGKLVGIVGFEKYGTLGLVRSLCVEPFYRGSGIGRTLLDRIEAAALSEGITWLYALTMTIETMLVRRGYEPVPRDDAPDDIRQTSEFRGLCPDSAALLRKCLR